MLGGTVMSVAQFFASGRQAGLRIPYITLEHPTAGLFTRVGELSEHAKLRFMVACIRHAWDQLPQDPESGLPLQILDTIGGLLDGVSVSAAEFRERIEAFQHVHDDLVSDASMMLAANLTYVTGAAASWVYHAMMAAEATPQRWFDYFVATGKCLPYWVVLHGASTIAPEERAWQVEAVEAFVDRPRPEIDVQAPAWMQAQMELGPVYLTFCVAPWEEKRALVGASPAISDPLRRMFARLVIERSGGANAELRAVLDANDVLLDFCEAVIADAADVGGRVERGLDAVFANRQLRDAVEGGAERET
jgi:hypothetical protein